MLNTQQPGIAIAFVLLGKMFFSRRLIPTTVAAANIIKNVWLTIASRKLVSLPIINCSGAVIVAPMNPQLRRVSLFIRLLLNIPIASMKIVMLTINARTQILLFVAGITGIVCDGRVIMVATAALQQATY